jgi:hypothetical protein
VIEGIADGGNRARRVSLGQPHQRETRLGIPPGAMCGQQGFLGACDVSPVQADPAELGQRPSELASQVVAQFFGGHERLRLRFVVRPAQPEDLGAVDPAAAAEAADGVRVAPPLHCLGPLLGQVVLGEALQGAHEFAIDDPGRERIEVAEDGRHSG